MKIHSDQLGAFVDAKVNSIMLYISFRLIAS